MINRRVSTLGLVIIFIPKGVSQVMIFLLVLRLTKEVSSLMRNKCTNLQLLNFQRQNPLGGFIFK